MRQEKGKFRQGVFYLKFTSLSYMPSLFRSSYVPHPPPPQKEKNFNEFVWIQRLSPARIEGGPAPMAMRQRWLLLTF